MPVELTDENFAEFIGEKSNAILDFYADWCGPCRAMNPEYKKAEETIVNAKTDLQFYKVNVDVAAKLAEQFKIECMPTIVLIKNGEIVERNMGAMNCARLMDMIKKHFTVKEVIVTDFA